MHCLNTLFSKLEVNQSIIFCNSVNSESIQAAVSVPLPLLFGGSSRMLDPPRHLPYKP